MPALVLALSVSNKIEQYGAYAGYAAILGIAVLALLYFAQAREVKRLREWAGRAPERAAEVQAQALQAAERARATPARPADAAVTPGAARAATPGQPPPATAAGAGPATPGGAPTPGLPGGATPGTPPAPGSPAASPGTAPASPATPAPAGQPPNGGTRPSTPGTGAPGQSVPADAPGRPGVPQPGTPAAPRPRRTVQVGSGGAASATVPPRAANGRDHDARGHSPLRVLLPLAVVLIAIIVVGVLVLSNGGGRGTPPRANRVVPQAGTGATAPPAGATHRKSETVIAVLNGTTVTGLARTVGDHLQAAGYTVDKVGDAADQAQQTSQVAYVDGFKRDADQVASIIHVGSVVPMDSSTQVVAGENAKVVVTVGADTAAKAQ
jgi:LytR cell envelope-related transcriptional attenuator